MKDSTDENTSIRLKKKDTKEKSEENNTGEMIRLKRKENNEKNSSTEDPTIRDHVQPETEQNTVNPK